MNILPTWPIAAGALAIGLAVGAYADHKVMQGRIDKITIAHAEELRLREVKRSEDERAARSREQQLAAKVGEIEQRKTDEIDRIRAGYADDIASLQQRANRKPASPSGVSAPSPACQGSTGAELSRADAGFLVGEAARADQLRTALGACYQAYDSLR